MSVFWCLHQIFSTPCSGPFASSFRIGVPSTVSCYSSQEVFHQMAQPRVQGALEPDCRGPLSCLESAPFPRCSEITKCARSSPPGKRNAFCPGDSSSISQVHSLTNFKRHGRATWQSFAVHLGHRRHPRLLSQLAGHPRDTFTSAQVRAEVQNFPRGAAVLV